MKASHLSRARCGCLSRHDGSKNLYINLLVPLSSFHSQPTSRFAASESSSGKGKAKASAGKGGRRPDGDEQRSVNIVDAALKPAIIHRVMFTSLLVLLQEVMLSTSSHVLA